MANGNIDQLNFEVLLHDKDFNDRIKADLEAAKKFNTSLSKILEIQNKIGTKQIVSSKGVDNAREMNQILTEIKSKMDGLPSSVKIVEDSTTKTADEEKRHGDNVRSTNSALSGSVNLMQTLTQLTGVYFGAAGVRRFVSSLVEVTGNLEMQREAMNHILGSAEKGEVIFGQLKELAKPSYFTLPDLTKYAKQLSALSIPYEELFETTKMLGDVSAGLGVSFERIALAYGHIRSMGFLRGMQARQLTNAGIPIFEELAKNLSKVEGKLVSISDVYDRMSKRQITFEQVKEVFVQMTSEGGKFYDMQIAMTETLAGRINKLKGVWEIALSDLGNANSGILKGTVNAAIKLVEHLDKIGAILTPLIKTFGACAAVLAVAAVAQKAVAGAQAIGQFMSLAKMIRSAKDAMVAFQLASKGVSLAFGALTFVGFGIYDWIIKPAKEAKKAALEAQHTIEGFMSSVKREKDELKKLTDQLEHATSGTKEYNDAKDEIIRKYDKYLSNVERENLLIGKTAGLYDSLAMSIEKASRSTFLANVDQMTQDKLKKANENISKSLDQFNLSDADRMMAMGYILGQIQKDALPETVKRLFAVAEKKAVVTGPGMVSYVDSDTTINYLDQLKTAYEEAAQAAEDAQKRIREALQPTDGFIGPEAPQDFWIVFHKTLNKVSDDELRKRLGGLFGYGDEHDWNEYRKKISKAYDELNAELAGAFNEERRKPLLQEINFIKQLDRAFGGHLLAGNKTTKREDTAADQQRKREAQDIKQEISLLQKYNATYEKLARHPLIGEDNAKSLMEQMFGETDLDYATRIDGLLNDLMSKANASDTEALKNYAEGIRAAFGKDAADEYIKSIEALDKWQKTLRKWQQDFGGDYSGIEYDIDKVRKDLVNADQQADDEYADALRELQKAHEGNAEKIAEETEALNKLLAARKEANRVSAQEKLNDLAKKYVSESTSGMSLKDWGDKSIGQVRALWKELEGLANGSVVIDETLMNEIAKAGLKIEDFAKLTKTEFKKLSKEAKEELEKKLASSLKNLMSELNTVAQAIKDFAEVTGNEVLADVADAFMGLGTAITNVAEKAMSGDWIGAITSGISWLAKEFLEARTRAEQLREAIEEVRQEAEKLRFDKLLSEGVDSIFGTNDWGSLENAVKGLEDVQERISSLGAQKEFRTYKPGWFEKLILWGATDRYKTIEELAQDLGFDSLFDENGNYNLDLLKAIRDTFPVTGDQQDWLDEEIAAIEEYNKALEQVRTVAESVFGEIADSVADKIVDSWWEAGNAALDYADIISDVAKSYAKLLVKSALFRRVFTDENIDDVLDSFESGDTAAAMKKIDALMQSVQALAPELSDILSAFDPYISSGSDTGSVGQGIQSITEDTADLLASYINAMRADVAAIRSQDAAGWRDVAALRETVPTLNDYLAQCAANTYDIARSNAEMLSELRSVIGPSGSGGRAVRCDIA